MTDPGTLFPGEPVTRLSSTLAQILDELQEIRECLGKKQKALFTIEEVAELVGRSPYTVRRWVQMGLINATRVSGTGPRGRLLVAREQIRRLIDQGLGTGVPAVLAGE